jgi:tetratricopeptide (TPR) repeat protein
MLRSSIRVCCVPKKSRLRFILKRDVPVARDKCGTLRHLENHFKTGALHIRYGVAGLDLFRFTQRDLWRASRGFLYKNIERGVLQIRRDKAIAYYRRALRHIHPSDHQRRAYCENNLGSAWRCRERGSAAKNVEGAFQCYQRALQSFSRDPDARRPRISDGIAGRIATARFGWDSRRQKAQLYRCRALGDRPQLRAYDRGVPGGHSANAEIGG